MKRKAKVGIVSLGHHVYWPQFDGLKEELSKKSAEFIKYFSNETDSVDLGVRRIIKKQFI